MSPGAQRRIVRATRSVDCAIAGMDDGASLQRQAVESAGD
jgi:hypothetical protein